ncbi:MAG: methylated-DNA--[protein]-cysteine S-methyltransferase [Bacteroidales bacterium]|nr:methylated-DNA--[protein]-cysteine S-methyltransferase [Bacteroidales bacterium]
MSSYTPIINSFAVRNSGTDCIHDQFLSIIGMTPEEFKNQGKNLVIHYSFAKGPFGNMLIASTHKGICQTSLARDENTAVENLKKSFPKATFRQVNEASHQNALSIFAKKLPPDPIILHVKGTDFQLEVWKALLKIPMGKLVSYGDIAGQTLHPKAYRAVGTAVGNNPVFFLIPCHRVIQSGGLIGNYFWGTEVKKDIIEWESKINFESSYFKRSAKSSGK